jgi:H+/Cl- antiporter ClcA
MKKERMSESDLMARLKVFIGVCLALTLVGIVFVVLYSLIFVTQPLGAISPIDTKFFEMIIPISTFLTGILSGIMLSSPPEKKKEEVKEIEEEFFEEEK